MPELPDEQSACTTNPIRCLSKTVIISVIIANSDTAMCKGGRIDGDQFGNQRANPTFRPFDQERSPSRRDLVIPYIISQGCNQRYPVPGVHRPNFDRFEH